jgi:Matrixin
MARLPQGRRARRARHALLALLAAALLAAPAEAAAYERSWSAPALRVARASLPSGCREPRVVPSGELPPGMLGTYSRPCTVIVNSGIWSYDRFCTTVVHEYGHLGGLGHSEDPANVMYPNFVRSFGPCL